MKRHNAFLILFAAAGLFACRRDDITVQRVPKEAPPTLPMPAAGGEMPSAPAPNADWTAPAGWKKLAPSQMRVGSYAVPTATDPIDVSVVPLGGDAGGDLANVNRWRGQLGLPPVDAAGLAAIAKHQAVGPYRALVVEFSSQDAKAKRILAVVIPHDGMTWFFKATGPDVDVRRIRSEFLRFAGSLRVKDGARE